MTNDKRTWQQKTMEHFSAYRVRTINATQSPLDIFIAGAVAGRKDAINEAQVLVDALNRYKGLCVHWNENHHETCGRPADEALAAWREKTGD